MAWQKLKQNDLESRRLEEAACLPACQPKKLKGSDCVIGSSERREDNVGEGRGGGESQCRLLQ